ncbi:PH-9 domain-containing protein [Fusarium keratoplasticum]|uniref:PH-9 domain-containing protein n=1 Tax=Fusarium keratoplasticum TaxID=1328300 RepID=A0ACC0R8H6_9HYPO|nr:PH-9 domain-containing protein [Fusarium keratoplasticum]KAI8675927.1 PH-9 domain-containing protein [Fusarium keratoplasticum]
MCGTAAREAHPSIIVFCRPSEFSCLRSLLNSKHLKLQYCLRKSSPRYSWKSWGKSVQANPSDAFKPLFNLYFWRAQRPRILYSHQHPMESISVFIEAPNSPHARLTASGRIVAIPHLSGGGHSTSTIGCILQVDSRFYGLTAAHLLDREMEISRRHKLRSPPHSHLRCLKAQEPDSISFATQSMASPSDDGSSTTSGYGMVESTYTAHTSIPDSVLYDQISDDDDDFVDDVEYQGLEENDQEAPRVVEGPESQPLPFETFPTHHPATFAPSSCSELCEYSRIPDNDWALVAMNVAEPQLPNAFFDASQTCQPTFFSSTPGSLPEEDTPVLIVASKQRVLCGMLQPVPSFLGGITRKGQAEYWTVVLSKGGALCTGDSGSVVIGGNSPNFVFGHVVGSNPLGEVYVSPLEATMNQIMGLLETTHVSLPEPLPLLSGLATYHLRKGDDYAFELLNYLDGLIQTSQQTSDWSSLESWALCYQRLELLETVKNSLRVAKDLEKVRILQKFSPDHSEKVLGLDLMFVAESTAISTTIKTGTSTIFTEDTDDSDYEFDGALTPKEPERTPRNSIDGDGRDSSATPGVSHHGFNSEQSRANDKVSGQRSVQFADDLRSPDEYHRVDRFDEDAGIVEDPSGSSQQRIRSGHAYPAWPRLSIEDDLVYQHLMTSRPRRPPSYEETVTFPHETLPGYSCDIDVEGVFMRKMEITNTIQRAEDRQWRMVYITLHGTALNIYGVKKSWQWGLTRDDGPSVDPDNPPWIDQGKLVKSYGLQHAEAGIAADYKKRRYVIRLRVETDQFLISCVELSTFVRWLDWLNAAIKVAAPLEDRDFPFDYSVPRIERIRRFRGQATTPDLDLDLSSRPNLPRSSTADINDDVAVGSGPNSPSVEGDLSRRWDSFDPRLSADSFPKDSIDPVTGKWFPRHEWGSAHDMLYAKLCYSNLLFKSPRRSSYVISNGKRWFVDWPTGRMVRVLPPTYGEVDYNGPWQAVHTENGRI